MPLCSNYRVGRAYPSWPADFLTIRCDGSHAGAAPPYPPIGNCGRPPP